MGDAGDGSGSDGASSGGASSGGASSGSGRGWGDAAAEDVVDVAVAEGQEHQEEVQLEPSPHRRAGRPRSPRNARYHFSPFFIEFSLNFH